MRNPLSDIIVDIPPSGIRKFFDVVSEMKGAISLGVGEPDFDTPWHVREEGIYSLEKGRTFYTSNAGLKELKQEIGKYLKRRMHIDYDYNTEILVTVGGSEAIDIALRAMLNPGEDDIVQGVVEGDKIEKAKAAENVQESTYARNGYGNVPMHTDFGATKEKEVRHAIAYILDKDDLINNILGGYGTTVNSDYATAYWTYQVKKAELDSKLINYAFSIDKA